MKKLATIMKKNKDKDYDPCPWKTTIGELSDTYSITPYKDDEIINRNSEFCRNYNKQFSTMFKCPYLIINDKGDIPYSYGRPMLCEKQYRIQRMKEILE